MSVIMTRLKDPPSMEKRTNLIFRKLFLPEWDSDMESFFDQALSELKRYSEEQDFPEWAHPSPEISDSRNCFTINFRVPNLEAESLQVEILENLVILAGLRWCRPPKETKEKPVLFRRLVKLPERVEQNDWRLSIETHDDVKLAVKKSTDELDSVEVNAINGHPDRNG